MEDKKILVTLYRHKEFKEFYLIRNWNICGGCEDTNFYSTTKNLKEAFNNMFKYNGKEYELADDFMYWNERFGEKLKVKIILEKEMDFDGYKGKLQKEVILNVCDFVPVYLSEERRGEYE